MRSYAIVGVPSSNKLNSTLADAVKSIVKSACTHNVRPKGKSTRMDFFTQTVDSSLWTSRTLDDPEYDEDESAAALGRAPITSTLQVSADSISTLIVGCGHDASLVLNAAMKLNSVGSFEGEELTVPVTALGEVACMTVEVTDSRAAQLANTALSTLCPDRTLVLCSVARWACRGRPNHGIAWMHSATAIPVSGPILRPPSFLEGSPAAFVADADSEGYALSAAVLVKEGITASYGDLQSMYHTVLDFVKDPHPKWIAVEEKFEEEVRKSLKSERASESAMYM